MQQEDINEYEKHRAGEAPAAQVFHLHLKAFIKQGSLFIYLFTYLLIYLIVLILYITGLRSEFVLFLIVWKLSGYVNNLIKYIHSISVSSLKCMIVSLNKNVSMTV